MAKAPPTDGADGAGASGWTRRGLEPGGRVTGTFRPPGSKSVGQRVLLAAAFARGTTFVRGLADGDDVRAARALVAARAQRIVPLGEDRLSVQGAPPGDEAPPGSRHVYPARRSSAGHVYEVGESGTLARLATAALAFGSEPGTPVEIRARGTLVLRSSRPLFASLAEAGVAIERQNVAGTWPVRLIARRPPAELRLVRPVSSQEASGLVLACAAHPGTRTVRIEGDVPSRPYLDMTLSVLERFGARVVAERTSRGTTIGVEGPLVAPEEDLDVEPDASGGAVLLAAACLSGGEVTLRGLGRDALQGDRRIVEHLAAFGCETEALEDSLSARGAPTRAAELDLTGEPDLAPVLAVVAVAAVRASGRPALLRGLGTLAGKESDRLAGLVAALEAAGFPARSDGESLRLVPAAEEVRGQAPPPLRLDPRGDHRMAFAFALLGLLRPGITVSDPDCVAKSWPGFWEDLASLGARLVDET